MVCQEALRLCKPSDALMVWITIQSEKKLGGSMCMHNQLSFISLEGQAASPLYKPKGMQVPCLVATCIMWLGICAASPLYKPKGMQVSCLIGTCIMILLSWMCRNMCQRVTGFSPFTDHF